MYSMLTKLVTGAVDDGLVLILVPPGVVLLPWERGAYLRDPACVLAAPARVHGAPVQPGASGGRGGMTIGMEISQHCEMK